MSVYTYLQQYYGNVKWRSKTTKRLFLTYKHKKIVLLLELLFTMKNELIRRGFTDEYKRENSHGLKKKKH